jgi:hypothetical protein
MNLQLAHKECLALLDTHFTYSDMNLIGRGFYAGVQWLAV